MSFYAVSSGSSTMAADVNQYSGAFNGTVGAQAKVVSATSTIPPYIGLLPSAPSGSDQDVYQAEVSSDAYARVSLYLRATDGYGGIRAGAGTGTPTAHLYAQAAGWQIDESLAILGALTVSGTTTLAGLNAGAVSASSLSAPSGTVQGNYLHSTGTVDGTLLHSTGNVQADGTLYAGTPVVLLAGHQETGFDGGTFYTNGSGVGAGVGVNFKTQLQNTPSSITLSTQANVAAGSIGAFLLQTTGFELHWLSTAAGSTVVYVTYTTVGNCLLSVDELTRTFDHHCDACKAVHRSVPVEALHAQIRPGEYHHRRNHLTRETHHYDAAVKLGYTCPDCGAVEAFDTRMTAADEADETPQGDGAYATTRGAQARLIRQLLTLLNLSLA